MYCIASICIVIKVNPDPAHAFTDTGAHRGDMMANAARERQRVEPPTVNASAPILCWARKVKKGIVALSVIGAKLAPVPERRHAARPKRFIRNEIPPEAPPGGL